MFCGSTSILFGKEEEKLSWNLMGKDLFVFDIYRGGGREEDEDEEKLLMKSWCICFLTKLLRNSPAFYHSVNKFCYIYKYTLTHTHIYFAPTILMWRIHFIVICIRQVFCWQRKTHILLYCIALAVCNEIFTLIKWKRSKKSI